MAQAKLHIICGNCGRNNGFKWKIDPQGVDFDGVQSPDVYITCGNCGTVHSLFTELGSRDVKESE